jgi:signal transduction histidine kinase
MGYGLLNMQERAIEIESIFSVESNPGNGTIIRISGKI